MTVYVLCGYLEMVFLFKLVFVVLDALKQVKVIYKKF